MKRTGKRIAALFLCALFLWLLPGAALAAEEEEAWDIPLTVAAAVSGVPEGAVMLDILVPENEVETEAFNQANGRAFGVTAESEIAKLNAEGYVSLTFCTPASQPRNELAYDITVAVLVEELEAEPERFTILEGVDYEEEYGTRYYDLRVIPGQAEEAEMLAFADSMGEYAAVYETIYTSFPMDWKQNYSAVRAAYLDAAGNVLGVSNVYGIDPDKPGGYWLDLNGLNLSPRMQELDYYYSPFWILPAAVLIVALLWAILLLLLLRIQKREKVRALPAFFFEKNVPSDPVLKKAEKKAVRRRSALRFGLCAVLFVAVVLVEIDLMYDTAQSATVILLAELGMLIAGLALGVALHELAHAFIGKRTGFGVTYLRVLCFVFTKENGRLRLCVRPGGFGGVTALCPPEKPAGEIRFAPMYLSGSIVNLLLAGVFFGCSLLCGDLPVLCASLRINALMNLFVALVNGVPGLQLNVRTDGTQLRDLSRSPAAREAHVDTMRISGALYGGERLETMLEAWFRAPTEESLRDPCGADNAAALFDRLLARHSFAEALALGERLAAPESALTAPQKGIVLRDLAFCMLLTGASPDDVRAYFCAERRRAVLRLRPSAGGLRLKYAWELLAANDPAAAAKTRALFEKRNKNRSLPAVAALDRDLIAQCDALAASRGAAEKSE